MDLCQLTTSLSSFNVKTVQNQEASYFLIATAISSKRLSIKRSAFELSLEEDLYKFDLEALKKELPIHPGQKTQIPLEVIANIASAGVILFFNYSTNTNTSFGRTFQLNIPLKVLSGPKVSSFDIIENKDDEGALLVIDVLNPTLALCKFDIFIENARAVEGVNINNDLLSDPSAVQRLTIPIKRFRLDPENLPDIPQPKGFLYFSHYFSIHRILNVSTDRTIHQNERII